MAPVRSGCGRSAHERALATWPKFTALTRRRLDLAESWIRAPGGWLNLPKILEITLNDGYDPVAQQQLGPHTGHPTEAVRAGLTALVVRTNETVSEALNYCAPADLRQG